MKFFDYLEAIKDNYAVAYIGRFCPPHEGHLNVFRKLQSKFGDKNVYIITSDKSKTSQLSFAQKIELFKMYGINTGFVRKMEASGYNAPAIMQATGEPETKSLIVAMGAKDAERLVIDKPKKSGEPSYFTMYKGEVSEPSTKRGYVYIIPNETSNDKVISATQIRNAEKYSDVKDIIPEGVFNKVKEFLHAQ